MDAANASQVVSTLTLANAAWERALERGQNIFTGVFGPMQAGVILAVCGNLVIACALALQKWVHNTIASRPVELRQPASRHPLFWVALAGLMAGELGNFAAFGLASPTVVSPLGAVAVIANALIAALVLREPFYMRNLLGLLLTVFGSVTVVLNAPPSIVELSPATFLALLLAPPSLVYLTVVLVSVSALYYYIPRFGSRYSLLHITLCSLLGAITVLCSDIYPYP